MPRGRKSTEVEDYQEIVYNSLRAIFGDHQVNKEWHIAKDSRDDFTRKLYCPRLDIAVGPFNISRNKNNNVKEIEKTFRNHRSFIDRMSDCAKQQDISIDELLYNGNKNPRCLLAIEIENSGAGKYMLGNMTNVSILGLIGVVIPFNEEKLSLSNRLRGYIDFATNVEKIGPIFKNVLIVNKENFLRVLNENKKGRSQKQKTKETVV